MATFQCMEKECANLPLLIIFTSSKQLLPLIERHAHRLVFGSFVLSGTMITGFVVYWLVFHLILRKSVSPTNHQTLRRFRTPTFWLLVVSRCDAGGSDLWSVQLCRRHHRGLPSYSVHSLPGVGADLRRLCGAGYSAAHVITSASADNLRARQVRTQMAVMRRLAIGFIGLLALGLILYTLQPHPPLAGWRGSAGFRGIGFSRACRGGEDHGIQPSGRHTDRDHRADSYRRRSHCRWPVGSD